MLERMRSNQSTGIAFAGNGRATVPGWPRKELGIKKDTRAIVYKEGKRIVLKPITPRYLKSLRGILKEGVLKALMADRKREH